MMVGLEESQNLLDLVDNSGGLTLRVPFTPVFGEGSPSNYKLNSKQKAQFEKERLLMYSSIQTAYRLDIALPAPTHKSDKWNLTVLPPKDLHARWLVNYPKRLPDRCPPEAVSAK
jgi:hypothetical protein